MSGASIGTLARVAVINRENPTLPLRRCDDCALNLTPGLTLRAAFVCPLFGFSRHAAELRCRRFEARAAS